MRDIAMPTKDDCLFCKIAAKKIATNVIYEDPRAIAFLDAMPRTAGHTLVIPKYHAATLPELPDEEVGPLFTAVKTVAIMLDGKLAPEGITIGINQGAASGQEVGHLHVHLMPRWNADGGGAIQSVVKNPPMETVEEIRKKII